MAEPHVPVRRYGLKVRRLRLLSRLLSLFPLRRKLHPSAGLDDVHHAAPHVLRLAQEQGQQDRWPRQDLKHRNVERAIPVRARRQPARHPMQDAIRSLNHN